MADTNKLPTHPTRLGKRYLTENFFRPRKPVSWLSPPQLAGTGLQVFLADKLGAYLDKREMQGVFSAESFESGGNDGIWFDFVADTGDGFNATYAIARQLALEKIEVGGETLLRGQVLVMGGDEVYPTPSPTEYDERLKGPFRAALPPVPEGSPVTEEHPAVPSGQPAPRLYALPGNHDWYDGLTAFFRVFAGPESAVGAWRTLQKRSYFALHLAEDWWLFAVDAQFGAHIDEPQLEYFHNIIRTQVKDGARVILCTPEPGWVQSKHKPAAYDATDYFLRKVISPAGQQVWLSRNDHEPTPKTLTVPLMLSGDWHHYSRYESVDQKGEKRQLITSGGGGAYLTGTHRLPLTGVVPPPSMRPPTTPPAKYTLKNRFPSFGASIWLGLGGIIRTPLRNPLFVLLLGALQFLLLFALQRSAVPATADTPLGTQTPHPTNTPAVIGTWMLFGLLTFFLASGLSSDKKRWRAIIPLWLLHAFAQVRLGYHGFQLWQQIPALDGKRLTEGLSSRPELRDAAVVAIDAIELPVQYLVYGLAAGLVSSVIVAIYFFVAGLFNVNFNELFSAQRIEGYKGFLRMHIDSGGDLTIYAIGLRRVRVPGPGALRWQYRLPAKPKPGQPWFRPRIEHRPHLIEKITIPRH